VNVACRTLAHAQCAGCRPEPEEVDDDVFSTGGGGSTGSGDGSTAVGAKRARSSSSDGAAGSLGGEIQTSKRRTAFKLQPTDLSAKAAEAVLVHAFKRVLAGEERAIGAERWNEQQWAPVVAKLVCEMRDPTLTQTLLGFILEVRGVRLAETTLLAAL
jgi:hypothetical protein